MIDLTKRSYQKEILDGDDIPFEDIAINMQELNYINTALGGHNITIAGVKKFFKSSGVTQSFTICEIGCGGGDNLNAINNWCVKNKVNVNFIGIDIKPACIEFAKKQYPGLPCTWVTCLYEKVIFDLQKPDIIFSSLFCHHFNNDQIVTMLQWMKQNSTKGFFINDLHRHGLAYYSIKILTRLFSASYLVKNDAPLSVARGFVLADWRQYFKASGIKNFSINWKWAFRYLIVCTND